MNRTILRSLYHKLAPKSLRSWVSRIRRAKSYAEYYRVTPEDSDNYLAGLVATSKYFSEQQALTSETLKPLHIAFAARNVRSHLLGHDWWADFVFAATNLDENSQDTQDKLVARIKALPLNTLQHWELLHVYALALRVGLFMVGYVLRCKAREVAIDYLRQGKKLSPAQLIAAIAAQMETGQYAEVQKNIAQLGRRYAREKQLLSYLYGLMAPERDAELIPNSGLDDSEQDREFRKLVQGKSIAVVGPAKVDRQDAAQIDSYELVVRCNYREKGVGVDDTVKGLRCDITYFNGVQDKYFCDQETVNWPHEIEWAVCKSQVRAERVAEKVTRFLDTCKDTGSFRNLHRFKTRALQPARRVIFHNKRLNAIPNIALDLHRFNPASIYVFHVDLFLTVERISSYHPDTMKIDNYLRQSVAALSSFSGVMDPITQYWILHELWQLGKIEGDSRFNEVMSLGEQEYMRQLQVIYGSLGRLSGEFQTVC